MCLVVQATCDGLTTRSAISDGVTVLFYLKRKIKLSKVKSVRRLRVLDAPRLPVRTPTPQCGVGVSTVTASSAVTIHFRLRYGYVKIKYLILTYMVTMKVVSNNYAIDLA